MTLSMSIDKSIRTTLLFQRLSEATSVRTFIREHRQYFVHKTLPDFLREQCESKNLVRAQAIKGANVDRTYGHQIFNGWKNPSRDKLLQIAFGLHLTVGETQEALLLADKRQLHPKILRDDIILFCLQKRMSIQDADELLLSYSMQPLERNTP